MDTSVLEDIGLSKNEVIVFVELLKLGESKAGKLITASKLQSSAVYNAISSLIEKGLVSYIKKSQVKYYKAAEPETVLEYINTKKREYEKLLPELNELQKRTDEEGVEFFKSFKGVKTILFEMFKEGGRKDIYRFFAPENSEEYNMAVERVFGAMKQLRKEKKIKSKGIYSPKVKHIVQPSKLTQRKFVDFPMPPNTHIYGDKVAIIDWRGKEPSGVLISSKDLVDSYVRFFEYFWEKGK